MVNVDSPRSASSYGDPRYPSGASLPVPTPPSKVLVDGYRDTLDPANEEKPRFNPLNPDHPRSSALLNINDPVSMYLLTEIAIGDSREYEILSFEEVEELKKELSFLSSRIEATKRKLALETKLCDAARSLSRLYSPRSSRHSDELAQDGSPHRKRRSIFGSNGVDETLDKADAELAISTRRCEELAQELWRLERRDQELQRRLLKHTAGILQMTHKGLKKKTNKNGANGAIPRTPESVYSSNATGSVHDFDDRSQYRTADYLDEFGGPLPKREMENETGGDSMTIGLSAIQDMEKRLEELSGRMREMILQANPDEDIDSVPQALNNGGPTNPAASLEAHVEYIENGLNTIEAQRQRLQEPRASDREPVYDVATEGRLGEINARLHEILGQSGSGSSLFASAPLPPDATGGSLQEQLSYLDTGLEGVQKRVESLLEQKSILTTQIQQQRELNSKSDAQRDAHIAELTQELAQVKKDLELSERNCQDTRKELALVIDQLDAARQGSTLDEQQRSKDSDVLDAEKEARLQAEEQVSQLEAALQQLRDEADDRVKEAGEARERAEREIQRLEEVVQQLRAEGDDRVKEASEARMRAEEEIQRLEASMQELRSETDERIRKADEQVEEAGEARKRAEYEVQQLEETIQQLRSDGDGRDKEVDDRIKEAEDRVREAGEARMRAEEEISRLEAAMQQLRSESDAHIKELDEARAQAEENASKLEAELRSMESEMVRAQTELTFAKAELDGAYGSRAQRAAEAVNPAIQKEIEELNMKNITLSEELAALQAERARRGPAGNSELQQRVEMLEKELRDTIEDYEVLTKASIEFEKERERYENAIDSLRDRCENLEAQLSDERIKWMGLSSATPFGRDGAIETTSLMMLKNEFKKMMRDTRAENMKLLKAEQEERRRLEALVRSLKKEQAAGKSHLAENTAA
ncbi:hypothetical protein VTN02DRAFT_3095 [Thermoascus thermophilus]